MTLKRVIRIFDRLNDELVDEVDLPQLDIKLLRRIFNQESDNPMFDCYAINKEQAEFICLYVKIDYQFDKFEYFLELK